MEGSELFLDKYKRWVVDYLGEKKTPLNEYEIGKKRKQSNKQKTTVAKTTPHKENQKRNRIKGLCGI